MNKKIVLSVNDIQKSFPGTKALKDVSIELFSGEAHAVVGENGAGKSTLMNIISGVYQADSDSILLNDQEIMLKNPSDAQKAGIGIVHQELALCPHLTVAENVFIGRLPKKNGVIDKKKLQNKTQEILAPFGASIHPGDAVAELSVAKQQIVEIAKVLALECKVIIFDEPTSSLNESEAQRLMQLISTIKKQGIGIFYISHKLSEIFHMCDRITVMRNGNVIETRNVDEINADYIVTKMVGKELDNLYPQKGEHIEKEREIFEARNYTCLPKFKNVSFSVKKGEIVGLCGLVGAGRTEVTRAICGLDKKVSGEVFLEGKAVHIKNHKNSLDHGICYLSEDRKLDGLFVEMNLEENMIAPELERVSKRGLVNHKIARMQLQEYKEKLGIKYSFPEQKMSSLSGGNQQKIMIAKLLVLNPKLIIMDEPTRGIDVGAKSEIHGMLRRLCDAGIGIVVISSEMPEIVGICDRVVIMHEGEVVGELEGENVTQENIIARLTESGKLREAKNG